MEPEETVLKQQPDPDQARRRKSIRQSARDLALVLANVDGLRRLQLVPAERWQEAADGEQKQ